MTSLLTYLIIHGSFLSGFKIYPGTADTVVAVIFIDENCIFAIFGSFVKLKHAIKKVGVGKIYQKTSNRLRMLF